MFVSARVRVAAWAAVTAGLIGVAPVTAATRTWTGAGGDGNWFSAANWNPSDLSPQADDAVVINGSVTVTLTNSTAGLASLALTNSTLFFTNAATTLAAAEVVIGSGATMTHAPCNTNAAGVTITNGVIVNCSNLTLSAGGEIDVSKKGHPTARSWSSWWVGRSR